MAAAIRTGFYLMSYFKSAIITKKPGFLFHFQADFDSGLDSVEEEEAADGQAETSPLAGHPAHGEDGSFSFFAEPAELFLSVT